MTYAQFISRLRAESKDLAKPAHNDMTGDNAITVFTLTDAPVLEGSYIVKKAGTPQVENTDFSIDLESGVITFAVAPTAGQAVTVDYKYIHLTDATWLNIINYIINDMEGEFWKEAVEDSSLGNSVANAVSYNGLTNMIDLIQFWFKTEDLATLEWRMVSEASNWRFSKDLNKIFLGKAFSVAGYPLRVHYLKGYTRGSATSSNLDMQDLYLDVLQLGCMWRYYDHRLANRVEIETKVAKERTITPLQNLQALSSHYRKLYLAEKGRKKPTKPSRIIGNNNREGGIP